MSLSLYKDQLSNHLRNPWVLSALVHVGLLLLVLISAYSHRHEVLNLSKSRTHALLIGRISLPSRAARKAALKQSTSSAKKMATPAKVKEVKKKPQAKIAPKIVPSASSKLVTLLPPLPKVTPLPAMEKIEPRVTPLPPEPIEEIKPHEPLVQPEPLAKEELQSSEPLAINEGQQECMSVIDALICHEFQKYWQAPDGITQTCTWLPHISPQGTCSKIEWVDQEPVPALAIAIRAACAKMVYPRPLWGKVKLVTL